MSAGSLRPGIELGELVREVSLGPHVQSRRAVAGALEELATGLTRCLKDRVGFGFRRANRCRSVPLDLEHAVHRVCHGHVGN
jgi:hypothetical protein